MHQTNSDWTISSAAELYQLQKWGAGYFGVNEDGWISVTPSQNPEQSLDMHKVVDAAMGEGLNFPLLVRFQDILHHRVKAMNETFAAAISEYQYQGQYRGVFPIKVNQMREVVEEIQRAGKPYHFGLEVGSKPELYGALAIHDDPDSLLICNGYKDNDFIRMALIGCKLDIKVIMVVEKIEELSRIINISQEMKIDPVIGVRVRLQTKGNGKWSSSGGENAKFGLSTAEILEAGEMLKAAGLQNALKLVHFHIGSQVPDILTIRSAVAEGARFYAKLCQLGFHLEYLDVGGGLGVDYDGSGSATENSTNYTLTEYAKAIVSTIGVVCDEEKTPHPNIVNESGRSLVAHHSVLIVEVFGTIEKTAKVFEPATPEDHRLVIQLSSLITRLNRRNRREALHSAVQIRDEASSRFDLGLIDLPTKAKIETGFWHLANKVLSMYEGQKNIPDEALDLLPQLSDQFLCNFSIFQSLIDHWAWGQVFPIMPIHRLNEAPVHQGTLVDITCDSDGKIQKFSGVDGMKKTLPLHSYNGQRYLIGIFLVGAYQDVMGDLHNLFGPVNEAHVFLDDDENDGFYIEETIDGCSISKVLEDVQYDTPQLQRLMKARIDEAIRTDKVKPTEGMKLLDKYERGLKNPTYLSFSE